MNHDHAGQLARYGMCLTCTDAGRHDDATRPEPAEQLRIPEPTPEFDGATYEHQADHLRLSAQAQRVADVIGDHEWRTLAELAALCDAPEASISARLRDLRKPKFGGRVIDRRRVYDDDGVFCGLHEYRLVPTSQPVQ